MQFLKALVSLVRRELLLVTKCPVEHLLSDLSLFQLKICKKWCYCSCSSWCNVIGATVRSINKNFSEVNRNFNLLYPDSWKFWWLVHYGPWFSPKQWSVITRSECMFCKFYLLWCQPKAEMKSKWGQQIFVQVFIIFKNWFVR